MAVEIKEIVIKAVLSNEEKAATPRANSEEAQKAMIQECVTQVLKVLQKKNRR